MNRLIKFMIVSLGIVVAMFLITIPLNDSYLDSYKPEPVEDNVKILFWGECVDGYPGISKEDHIKNQKFLYEHGYIKEVVGWCD